MRPRERIRPLPRRSGCHVILALSSLEAHDGILDGGSQAIDRPDDAILLLELQAKTHSTGTVAGLALLTGVKVLTSSEMNQVSSVTAMKVGNPPATKTLPTTTMTTNLNASRRPVSSA